MLKEFDEIIGYDSIKYELERILDVMKNHDKYAKLGVKTTNGVLLHGKPGVGKTTFVNAFIKASGRPYFVCRKDKSDGSFVDKIREIFAEAKEKAPSIVFLDDMDKFSNEDEKHANTDEFITIQSCIDDVKDDEVFVIATANRIKELPESLLRPGRFDKHIKLYLPSNKDSVKIVKHYLSTKQNIGDIDVNEIAKILDGRSCAELETVINEAGIYAGFENREKIEMKDVVRACLRVIYGAPELLNDKDKMFIKQTAYHEAGHAVVAEVLEANSVSIVSVKKYDSDIGGITGQYHSDDCWIDKDKMEQRVMSALGGKAATELVFGKVDVGTSSDTNCAEYLVEDFVDSYTSYGFGNYVHYSNCASEEIKSNKDRIIAFEMERFYQQAKRILAENREFLDKVANALIENETLICSDIQRIKATCKIVR